MTKQKHSSKLVILLLVIIIISLLVWGYHQSTKVTNLPPATTGQNNTDPDLAINNLTKLSVKPAESNQDYDRSNFLKSWGKWRGCNVRQKILNRDVTNKQLDLDGCTVIKGSLSDPYTGKVIKLNSKSSISKSVQIDHVVALGNAWRTGARYLNKEQRNLLANDDLELIAVSSQANQSKSNMDAAEWLPSNKSFRCTYVARQIAVKLKYHLWITPSEQSAIKSVLKTCPAQKMPAQ